MSWDPNGPDYQYDLTGEPIKRPVKTKKIKNEERNSRRRAKTAEVFHKFQTPSFFNSN